MKKLHLIGMGVVMLFVVMVLIAGCKKDSAQPDNGNSGGGNGGNSTLTEEGIYLGIIGFNQHFINKEIGLLNNSTLSSYQSFINNLNMENGTGLYYAVYTALNKLKNNPQPPKLTNVALVTFTDGLDNVSLGSYETNPEQYTSTAAYRTALNNKIKTETIYGKTLAAYTIGIKGSDVYDEEEFHKNLNMLASSANNVYEVTDMTQALQCFAQIAESLHSVTTNTSLKLQLPGGYDNGQLIRITFDNVSDAANSTKYIECTYKWSDNGRRLENITYHGLSVGQSYLNSISQIGLYYEFEFKNLTHANGSVIQQSDINKLKLWRKISSGAWQPDVEFTPANSSQVIEEQSSALIMLVLDCTTSLGNDFSSMKNAAKQFVSTLISSNGGGGGGSTTTTPTVTTTSVSDITSSSAKCGGNVISDGGTSVTARGICWSTSHNPTINNSHTSSGTGTGTFTASMTGLSASTTYYVRAYATNNKGTSYGEQRTFATTSGGGGGGNHVPTVVVVSINSITQSSAICRGNVTDDGGSSVVERGFCWNTTPSPTINNNHLSNEDGTGIYTIKLSGLSPNTTYYVKAYAINNAGVAYSDQQTFSTHTNINLPTVTTDPVTNISKTSATCGGNVTNDGGGTITERGVCWSTHNNPSLDDYYTVDGGGTGSYNSSLTGLSESTTYYVRAYATNSTGTKYGEVISFTTPYDVPSGAFSIGNHNSVYFAQGNLQYKASTNTWRFADHQWDYIGENNNNISPTYNGWIDLFGWGTGNNPTTYSTNNNDYSVFNDWGNNTIFNGGTNTWRTLTTEEWEYVFNTRITPSGMRYARATVNGISGIILLPDNWQSSIYYLNGFNTTNIVNTITLSDWVNKLEVNGAVFLPQAGFRVGTSTTISATYGYYWSSSSTHNNYAWYLVYSVNGVYTHTNYRYYGYSVRLVCPAE